MGSLLKIFDLYTIHARLLPALIAIVSPVALISTFININEYIIANSLVSLIATLAFIPLLGSVARTQGQKVEKKILKRWKVLPTTRFLRHSDETYSTQKKARLHKLLSDKSSIQLPSKEEESTNPALADETYNEAVSWLRENTRDSKFAILLNENIAYGKYRNLLGLRPIGIVLSIFPLLIFSLLFLLNYPDINNFNLVQSITFFKEIRLAYWVTTAISISSLIFWFFFINEAVLEKIAHKYAHTLFKQLDSL